MKTLIYLFLATLTFIGCTKDTFEPISEENVYVTLDYAFPVKTGDMATKGESLYLDFYTEYIGSKILTPKTYYINFYDSKTKVITSVSGKWGDKSLVALPPGTYATEGISWPLNYVACGDTAYLRFKDTITITQTSTNLTLKAYYDCSLILLDTTGVLSTRLYLPPSDTTNFNFYRPYYMSVKPTMMKTENFYHTFFFIGAAMGIGYDKVNLILEVVSSYKLAVESPEGLVLQNKNTRFPLFIYNWEAGKYYYFENTDSEYALTPMTN